MRSSRWVKLFGLGIISGICAPAVLASIVGHRSARRRWARFYRPFAATVAKQRDSWCCDFTLNELWTGEIRRGAR